MLSRQFSAIFFALCSLVGIGNQAYSVEYELNEETGKWVFNVWANGYTEVNEVGNREPIDTLMVSTQTKRLTVLKAMNGLDKTEPRLKMRQVLKECWTMTGLKPSELKEVLGYRIENTDMQKAVADCRAGMDLQSGNSFEISSTETDTARKTCWERLGRTVFSSAIRGAISDFDINKQLIQIKVDNGGNWDHVYYEFS
ncbi:hypothetical protein ColLi_10312 [Colletotrichum liriopes]|uniref:Uncharacterized protein n=1 Tax=Colletotrichum liriopes TaxID=708192 RepID=A0AA37LWK6_9PEZI|nr:hypothetical protein ColLi_10312 [Colletotrichum liriopes]